jgi:hypothetical protein
MQPYRYVTTFLDQNAGVRTRTFWLLVIYDRPILKSGTSTIIQLSFELFSSDLRSPTLVDEGVRNTVDELVCIFCDPLQRHNDASLCITVLSTLILTAYWPLATE